MYMAYLSLSKLNYDISLKLSDAKFDIILGPILNQLWRIYKIIVSPCSAVSTTLAVQILKST